MILEFVYSCTNLSILISYFYSTTFEQVMPLYLFDNFVYIAD